MTLEAAAPVAPRAIRGAGASGPGPRSPARARASWLAVLLALGACGEPSSSSTLDVRVTPGGTTTPSPGQHVYTVNAAVQVEAVPDRGWRFEGWAGDATGDTNPLRVVMDGDKELTARFVEAAGAHVLTVAVSGAGTTAPAAGAHAYPAGTAVEVTANPSPGATFSGWSGAASGDATRTTVTLDADKELTATFTAGGSGFQPCPRDGTPCKVMPLGDSITHGYPTVGGYRIELFRLAGAGKKAMAFVGTKSDNGPATVDGRPFPTRHEGWGGYTITGIHNLVQGALTSQRPHVVLLMIGTNDVNGRQDLARAPERLGLLLDRIVGTSPDALVVVARMVPTTDDSLNALVRTYNDGVAAAVKQRSDAGKHLLLVDMYAAFTANARFKTELMADRLHPKAAGYAEMARVWYAAIERVLPAAP